LKLFVVLLSGMEIRKNYILLIAIIVSILPVTAQISPGDLATPHAQLEGLSNCTQCHILGEKVSNDKCLACHKELKKRVDQQLGYHSSSVIKGKECISCHSDHHGRNFELVRIAFDSFDHALTGYKLEGKHAKKDCKDCHKPEFITDPDVRKKQKTFLGLGKECLTCHDDYHQKTLPVNCASCHNYETFKPASEFDHSKAKFKLLGQHQQVECLKCHKIETLNGKKFQQFTGVQYSNCTSCHKDIHNNQFGQNCTQCHNEDSFHNVGGMKDFNHSKTGFNLEGKHQYVKCSLCHKTKFTDPVKHQKCTDCHTDYHKGQFIAQGTSPDCSTCHNVNGFSEFNYTIEQHNAGSFPLQGAHIATPCFACHLKEKTWNFRNIGKRCDDCHENIHQTAISEKFNSPGACNTCHNPNRWSEVRFDHSKTSFSLEGAHAAQSCKSCHFKKDNDEKVHQQFAGLPVNCSGCHTDKHNRQFEKNGVTDCVSCHDFNNWKAGKFDHNFSRFKLDGKHKDVACNKCHKTVQTAQLTYIQYKMEDIRCEACHK
jgi:hypothetical protein